MELESAIQELISRLEFVSLPGLGSFVKKYEPASPSADGKTFNPPREFFIFDPSRIFNDEALENYICETSNIDHKKASAIVEQYVQDIKGRLSKGIEVSFDGIGTLKQNTKGDFELIPSDNVLSKTYGLGKVEMAQKTTEKKKVEPVTPAKKVEVKPPVKAEVTPKPAATGKSKTSIFVPLVVIFAIIAIVAVVLFVPELRFWETNNNIDTELVAQAEEESSNSDDDFATPFDSTDIDTNATINEPDTLPVTAEPSSTSEIKTTTAVPDKKVALYYQESKQEEGKTFYIIAGSFTQENNAQKLIQDLSVKGYKPLLIQNNNMYRVAIYKFTNRDRALRELERLKSQKISDKVWLLTL